MNTTVSQSVGQADRQPDKHFIQCNYILELAVEEAMDLSQDGLRNNEWYTGWSVAWYLLASKGRLGKMRGIGCGM
jgi:hypothetical protein